MHPILADARRLLWYELAWLAAGVGIAALLRLTEQAAWTGALEFALPLCVVWSFDAMSSYYICRTQPYSQRRWPATLSLFAVASLLSGLVWLGGGVAWNAAGRLLARGPFITMSAAGWVIFFAAGVGLFLLSLLAHDVLIAFETVQAAARREAESRVLARDAELQMLRTQINPHFLFNSLNSISALTGFDPAAAREMTVDLAQFFRRTLALAERERITLGEEVALCGHFLAIEKRRFGAKLNTELRVSAEASECLLPPMTLQPLLENAIKHGIRQVDGGGTIAVDAVVRDGALHIAVVNPVAADETPPDAHGVGLKNIRERLDVLYGPRARIGWQRSPTQFAIEIQLPVDKETRA